MEAIVTDSTVRNWLFERVALYYEGWNLSGMIRSRLSQDSEITYIIDITSARAFRHFSSNMQLFYREHGFNENHSTAKGFWMACLDDFISTMKNSCPSVRMIVIKSLEKNRIALERIIFWYFPDSSVLIKRVGWWWEDSVATLYLE